MSTKKSDKNLNCKGFFLLVPTVCNVCCTSYTGLRGCVYAFPDKRDLCASHALYWCTGFRLLLSDSTVRPVSRMSSWRWLGASLMGYHTDGSVRQRQHNKTKQNKTKENKICTDLANHSESTKVITSTSTVTYNWAWIFFFYTYIFYPLLLQPRYQNPSANSMPMIVIPPLLYVNTLSFPMTWIVFQTLR